MKILFVLENYYPHIGGVEVLFKNLAEGLAKKHQVIVLTRKLPGTKKYEVLNKVKIHRVSAPNRYVFTFFSIPKAIDLGRKADIIHTTTFNAAFPAWLSARANGKPSLITVHEVWVGKWNKYTDMRGIKAKLFDFLERPIYMLGFDKFVGVSKSTQNQLKNLGISEKKIEQVYNPVDYKHFSKKYNPSKIKKKYKLGNKFVVLAYGRLAPSKGIENLVIAFAQIKKKIKNAKLILILSTAQYPERFSRLKKMINQLGIEKQVEIIQSVSWKELPNYIKTANVVVVPSLAEGFGYTAAEASALKIPVVASNTTSLPEVVSGKYVLVKPNSPKAIEQGVIMVKKKQYKTSKLKYFRLNDTLKGYTLVYEKLLNKKFK